MPIGGLGRYEDIHAARTTQELITPGPIGQFNRLRHLTGELYTHYESPVLPYWNTITGPTGPDTVGGIGVTQFSRDVQGNLDQLLRFPGEQTSGQIVNSVQGIFNTLTPAQYLRIRRTDDSKYGNQGFATGTQGNNSPLMLTQTTDSFKGAYAYDRDILIDRKDFPVVTSATNSKVFLVTRGTRPDLNNNDWKIQIPTKVNIRTSGDASPVLLSDATFADLANNPKYFRSYRNPYNGGPGVGFQNNIEESQLESRYGVTAIPGIANSELTNGPGSGQSLPQGGVPGDPRFNIKPIDSRNASIHVYNNPNVLSENSNEVAMRSIYYPFTVGPSYEGRSHIVHSTLNLSTILTEYRKEGTEVANDIRKIYRDAYTPYGRNNGIGYSNTSTPGALNTGDSPLQSKQEKLASDGLDIGNDQIGKRLRDPKDKSGFTNSVNLDGNSYGNIRGYAAMTYPHMMMISKGRSLPTTGRKRPALLEFTKPNDGNNDPTWDKTNSPMAEFVNKKNGWLNDGANTDPNFWQKETSTRKRPISSGPNMDLITFKIGGNRFKAYITDWSDKISQGLNKFKPAGSPIDVVAGASSFERSVSISFLVAARSHNELRTIYKGLVNLQNLVKPNYIGGGAWAPNLTNLTIGDIYGKDGGGISVYITEMSLSIDNEFPWEIEDTEQVPMYLNVDLSFEWPNGGAINLPGQGTTPPFEDDEEEEWKIYNDEMDAEINNRATDVEKAKQIDNLTNTPEWQQAEATNFGRNPSSTTPVTSNTLNPGAPEVTGLPAGTNYGFGF